MKKVTTILYIFILTLALVSCTENNNLQNNGNTTTNVQSEIPNSISNSTNLSSNAPDSESGIPDVMGLDYNSAKTLIESFGFVVLAVEADAEIILANSRPGDLSSTTTGKKGQVFKVNGWVDTSFYNPQLNGNTVVIHYAKEDYNYEKGSIPTNRTTSASSTQNSIVLSSNAEFSENFDKIPDIMGVDYATAKSLLEIFGFDVTTIEADADTILGNSRPGDLLDFQVGKKGQVFKVNEWVCTYNYNPSMDKKIILYYASNDYLFEQ